MRKRDFFNKRKNVLYPSAADYLNYVPFSCFIPFYALPQPIEYREGITINVPGVQEEWEEFLPIYEPVGGPNQLAKTNLTIKDMVDLHQRKVTIIWEEDFDVPIILNWIDDYFESVQEKVYEGNLAIIQYCYKLVDFRDEFFKTVFLRLFNIHGVIREMYCEESTFQKMIDIADIRNRHSSVPDSLQRLAHAPIDLPPLPEETQMFMKVPVDEKSSIKERSRESAKYINSLRILLSI